MTDGTLSQIIEDTARSVRARWDSLGCVDAAQGAFATGHIPATGSHAYLCRFYAGLSEAALTEAEAESERYLPDPYRAFLRSYNGAHIMGISLLGGTGGQSLRDPGESIGNPVSIRYQNAFYLRPDYIPEGHFGIGSMNGEFYSQGQLYLTSAGEVELINRDHDLIAFKWPSFAGFLAREIPRQMSRYDDAGSETKAVARLPGNTDNWEALGKVLNDQRQKDGTVLGKLASKVRGLRKS